MAFDSEFKAFVISRTASASLESWEQLLTHAALGLGEAGEVQNLVAKIMFGKMTVDEGIPKLREEMADLLFYWVMGACAVDITFDEAFDILKKKLAAGHGWTRQEQHE